MVDGAADPLRDLGAPGCVEMLRRMWRVRLFEQAAERLAKRGEVRGAVHLSLGQEGSAVGACMALRPDDRMTGTHRSHGHPIAKGAGLRGLMAELYGRSSGVCRGKGGSMHLADFSVGSLGEAAVVAASVPVAVGAGLAAVLNGDDRVCLAFFGDGAVNEGVWHEAANLAGVWRLPVIFLCENNIYAGTTPNAQVSAVPSVADRASAYRMPGTTVDGQDVLAVYGAVSMAVARARRGAGPSVVEALTYMYGGHAVGFGDRLGGRRPDGEMERWRARDPVLMFDALLRRREVASDERLDRIRDEVVDEVADAVEFARGAPEPEPDQLWQDMFADAHAWARPEVIGS